ncbi:LPXTG cell wall anchor domain-containing protein [Lentzea sp. PSKA42]|uniref:LPXTG cell wall anchor domain-containing protein n=1 Tax=Lentzea indica TaxID=2604800 RepID=A0ABX1FA58_9PSEU|nr:SpaA isopeptide-forming pilin-related protein [Lentzea indica]NKE55606.1 LPXTG cell wall anchor domain-containing protein [Lentzea indica]
MKNVFAVATTAALVLTAAGTPAFAQDEKIAIEGLLYLDRNGSRAHDAGEVVLANEPGTIVKAESGETVAQFSTDANGKYRVENLPAGTYRVELDAAMRDFHSPVSPRERTTTGGVVDVRFFGAHFYGFSFLDKNEDRVRQADEELLNPGTLNGKPLPMPNDEGKFDVDDLRAGDYTFVAADYTDKKYRLVTESEVDRATRTVTFKLAKFANFKTVDVRNVPIKGDFAAEVPVLTPSKDTYVLGDAADVVIKISNKGEVAEKPSFVLASYDAETLSHSDNVVAYNHTGFEFESKDPIAPGKSIDVKLRIKFTTTKIESLHVIVRPSKFGKDSFKDNVAVKPIKVVEKGATTAPSSSQTAAPTTTTTPAVAKAGNKSGLASTGASPLGFLALGALLLAAGTGAFFVARRRRS